jgi:hypothetical protein
MLRNTWRQAARITLTLFAVGVVPLGLAVAENPAKPNGNWTAALVQAEVAGDSASRTSVLQGAVQADPDSASARWQLGQIEVDGKWQSVEEAQKNAAADPRQREYAKLRESAGDSPKAQLTLARWCERNGLTDEARIHWLSVLAVEPNSGEALRALKMEWFQGELLSREDATRAKEETKVQERSSREWNAKMAEWKRNLAGELPDRTAALAEIQAVRDPKAIPVIERITLDHSLMDDLGIIRQRQVSMCLLHALAGMPDAEAIQSQLQHAAFSPQESVRERAIADLKKRPKQDYVPYLLDALATPLESSFNVGTAADGSVHYTHSFYRPGRSADWSLHANQGVLLRDLQGRHTYFRRDGSSVDRGPAQSEEEAQREIALVAANSRRVFRLRAIALEQSKEQLNKLASEWNNLVYQLLVATTSEDFGSDVRAWWNWWDEYNEQYVDGPTPLVENSYYRYANYYYGPATYEVEPPPPGRRSCFAKGTLVWTKVGQRPIETLQIGDLVLSKDVHTGRLGYKPVVGTTIRPASEILIVKTGDDSIETTLGHPFWASGSGWKMAKELDEGTVLHGVKSPARVDDIETAKSAEAYNLIVADFATYFVGKSGLLVHDNTAREPTLASIPGIHRK